jgi:hypothetical protein
VFPVYGFAKLERDALTRIPELEALVVDPSADQLLVRPPAFPLSGTPLRSILLPRIVDRAETSMSAVSARDAWHTLVHGGLMEGEGAGGTTLPALTRLVQTTACHRIELGSCRAGVVAAVRRALVEQ